VLRGGGMAQQAYVPQAVPEQASMPGPFTRSGFNQEDKVPWDGTSPWQVQDAYAQHPMLMLVHGIQPFVGARR